jgi:hypothetical protein
MKERLSKFLNNMEWRLSLGQILWSSLKALGLVSSFALPAWAAKTANVFVQYSPLSWVVSGFCGLLLTALTYAIYGWARTKIARGQYDSLMATKGAWVDPLAKSYEDKRIYLNDLCLPSFPLLENKTFINCEIIGPANVVPEYGNNIQEPRFPICDAVWLKDGHNLFNATIFRNCTFRNCSFQRITFLVPFTEREGMGNWGFLNIINDKPTDMKIVTPANDLPLLPPSTGVEKKRKNPRD